MIATLYRKSAHIGQQQGLTALAISHLSPTRVVAGLVVSQRPLPTRYTTMNDTIPTLSTEARTTSISSLRQPHQGQLRQLDVPPRHESRSDGGEQHTKGRHPSKTRNPRCLAATGALGFLTTPGTDSSGVA